MMMTEEILLTFALFTVLALIVRVSYQCFRLAGAGAMSGAMPAPSFYIDDPTTICAELPFIVASTAGDPSPQLRSILTHDLGVGPITEITGGGSMWWDFTYRGKRYTCRLLPAGKGVTKLCRTNLSSLSERELHMLKELVRKIGVGAEEG